MSPTALTPSSYGVVVIRYIFVEDVMFFLHNGLYSGINFAMKDRFCLNLLFTINSDKIQFPIIIKGHNFNQLFRNYRLTNYSKRGMEKFDEASKL